MDYRKISNLRQFEVIELADEEYKIVTLNNLKKIEKFAIKFDGFTGHRNCGGIEKIIKECVKSEVTKLMDTIGEISQAISSGDKDKFHWANRELKIILKEFKDGKAD